MAKKWPDFQSSQFFKKSSNSFFGGQTFRQIFQNIYFFGPHNGQSGNPGIVRDDIAVEFFSIQILVDGWIEMKICSF